MASASIELVQEATSARRTAAADHILEVRVSAMSESFKRLDAVRVCGTSSPPWKCVPVSEADTREQLMSRES